MNPEQPNKNESIALEKDSLLNKEKIKNLNTLEISTVADFSEILKKISAETGVDLKPRPEGFHITIIGPTESKILLKLTEEKISELEKINNLIQKGEGIEIKGIGYIDSSTNKNLKEKDKNKKVCFLALEIPSLNNFRTSIGLPQKDFHITLGFKEGDVHIMTDGKDEKGKEKTVPISKKADPKYDIYLKELPKITFSSLGGQEKQKPKNNSENKK